MATVDYDDLLFACEFVSSSFALDSSAYISRDTGKIFCMSDSGVDEDIPDDIHTSDRYVAVPHKNDLDLGRNLALRFVRQSLPEDYDQVYGFFQRNGAYARFKDLLQRAGALDKWYEFEQEATRLALTDWCFEHDIELRQIADNSAA